MVDPTTAVAGLCALVVLTSLEPATQWGGDTGHRAFDEAFVARGAVADLAFLTRVVRALSRGPLDASERMRQWAADPDPEVRYRTVRAIFGHDRQLGLVLAADLRKESHPTGRAIASILLRDEGLERAATDPLVAPDVRVRAAEVLHQVGTGEQRLRAGARLLETSDPRLQRRGLELLERVGPAAEPAVLAFVPRAEPDLLREALSVLVQVGTVASVPALRARQAELSLLQRGLSSAIDQTVATLQGRAGGEGSRWSRHRAPCPWPEPCPPRRAPSRRI